MKHKIKRALLYPIFHAAYFMERQLTEFVLKTDSKYGFIKWTAYDVKNRYVITDRFGETE